MSQLVIYEIACKRCGFVDRSVSVSGHPTTAQAFRAELERAGWVAVVRGMICPRCAAKEAKLKQ